MKFSHPSLYPKNSSFFRVSVVDSSDDVFHCSKCNGSTFIVLPDSDFKSDFASFKCSCCSSIFQSSPSTGIIRISD